MPLTLVNVAPGTSIVVRTPFLLNTKPWVLPSVSSNSPAIASRLLPLTAVREEPGTSYVVKLYCALAGAGKPGTGPEPGSRGFFESVIGELLRQVVIAGSPGKHSRELSRSDRVVIRLIHRESHGLGSRVCGARNRLSPRRAQTGARTARPLLKAEPHSPSLVVPVTPEASASLRQRVLYLCSRPFRS